MCGIVGVISNSHKYKHEQVFKQLLIADVLRGFHSTGVIAVAPTGWDHIKKAMTSLDLVDHKEYTEIMRLPTINRPSVLIGHNRQATKGSINNVNAHPFETPNLIGVHNGTLQRFTKLVNYKDYDTDSEALFNHIDSQGLNDALNKAEGAYALIWYDKSEDRLKIIRNSERPLCIAKIKNEDTLVLASERGLLSWICHRNDMEVESYYSPVENMLHEFDLSGKNWIDPEVNKVEVVSEYPKAVSYQRNNGNYSNGYNVRTQLEMENETGLRARDVVPVHFVRDIKYSTSPASSSRIIGYMVTPPFLEVEEHNISNPSELIGKTVHRQIIRMVDKGVTQDAVCIVKPTDKDAIWRDQRSSVLGLPVLGRDGPLVQEKYQGPFGLINKEKMDSLCADGCIVCEEPIYETMYDFIEWETPINGDEDTSFPICPACANKHSQAVH